MRSFQILVVEDFEAYRRVVCSILRERVEFQIAEASHGLEAVRKAEQLQPDLVLLDIGLPYLNGIEVCDCVRKVSLVSEILFLSQEASPDIVEEAPRVGALGFVQKSQTQNDLLRAIDAVLKGKRFLSRGLLAMSPQGQNGEPIGGPDTPQYPWQQTV